MNVKECYEAFNGDYNDAMRRLMKESFIKRILLKFPEDDNMNKLTKAIEERNCADAFAAVHSIKGLALNLGFSDLIKSSVSLTEMLRAGNIDAGCEFYPNVKADYDRVVGAIKQLSESGNI